MGHAPHAQAARNLGSEGIAAVAELALGYFVGHMAAHLAPYGRAVQTVDGRDLEAVSDAFHAAFVDLIIQATAYHGKKPSLQKRISGAYETELEAHRAEQRERTRAKRKRDEGDK